MEERYIRRDDYITKYLKEMEVFAKNNNVPIVRKQTLSVILDLVREKVEEKKETKREIRILELGTASISMESIDNNIIIDTIEKSKKMYDIAKDNIEKLNICDNNFKNRINMYLGDAFRLLQENIEDETGKKVNICNE